VNDDLARAVLDTLLREDFCGLVTNGSVVDGRLWFDLDGTTASIPLRPDGFLSDFAVRADPV
jgi:hypothetical protein